MGKINYYGIVATFITVAILAWSAHLAIHVQPLTAMLLMIPVLAVRPFAFGFHVEGWRRWLRKFDPAYFAMMFLIFSLGLGMGTGSVIGDQIARTAFWIMAALSTSLMLYIDVYQWKCRDGVPAPSGK